jgi:hypothetical protein
MSSGIGGFRSGKGREPLHVCSLFVPVKSHSWSVVPQANFRLLWVANYR